MGDFRADVLLSSSKNESVLLVEFAVHHPCEPEKVVSGYRIIEFTILEERDVEALRLGNISEGADQHVALYNFAETVQTRPVCNGECNRTVGVFLVHPSARSVLVEARPIQVLEGKIGPGAVHREVLGRIPEGVDRMELYRRKVRDAHFNGVPIRNCFICRYHGLDGIDHAIFCKLLRTSLPSNSAVECEKYRPLESPDACSAVDQANHEYLKARARKYHW